MLLNDFTSAELTAAINRFPVQWGRINQSGLFPARGLRTRTAIVEERSGTLAVLPSHEWGGTGSVASQTDRNTYAFPIKQTVHEDTVLPDDVQDVRAFGTDSALSTFASEISFRMERIRARHDITLEWKRMGALRGIVTNNDGSTLADLFTTFGIAQTTVFFDLSNANADILAKCAAVLNQIEDNLKGDSMTGVRCLVSPEFYQAFIKHPKVIDAYEHHSEASRRMGTDMRRGFDFGGVIFEEYRGVVDGSRLIAANLGHAYPEGTTNTFATYFAPADFNEAVNTIGLPFYAKMEEKQFGRGMLLHTQCNSLPICHQPSVLVKVSSAAS